MSYKERAEDLDFDDLDNGLHVGLAEEADQEIKVNNYAMIATNNIFREKLEAKDVEITELKEDLKACDPCPICEIHIKDLAYEKTTSNIFCELNEMQKKELEANKKELDLFRELLKSNGLIGDRDGIDSLWIECSWVPIRELLTNQDSVWIKGVDNV